MPTRPATAAMLLPKGLRGRVLAWTLAILVAIAVPAAGIFVWLVDSSVVKLGTLFAEKQILFDRYRGLESLMREVSLAETVARSPAILDWAQDEADPVKAQRGLAELEHYRLSFKDRSYFVVLDGSGNYYFNDKANTYENDRLRYTLTRDNPRDGWYFQTIAQGSGCHLNVDHDDNIKVTKVWINCIIRSGERVLGIIGTGVDLSQFIREVVDIPQTGVHSMFVDRNGAVQAHRDPKLVDFHSLTKDSKAKKTIFLQLDHERDRRALAEMMRQVAAGDALVSSRFMQIDGHRSLVGVGYLDRLGWFNVTIMDVEAIIDRRLFLPIALLLAAMLVAAAALLTLAFQRRVLDRLARVEGDVQKVRAGQFDQVTSDGGDDEIGRLSRAFGEMAGAIRDNTDRLEEMVRARTHDLERLAQLDPLTGIFNRRGFERAFDAGQSRARRAGRPMGLLLIDIDHFKAINDVYGHREGDLVILAVVQRLTWLLRGCDVCARWGGDEFILLLDAADRASLAAVAGKIGASLRAQPVVLAEGRCLPVSVSIGASLVREGQSLADAANEADRALYAAKQAGRDTFILFDDAGRSEPRPAQPISG
ncbi:MAG: diguanylate cyclase [Bosea sp. (in: a-proteobacteria)]|uniref:sensor domain-containing diguanylate cyclase n=1 Tax=Bosea sp. (in: a-proteobacteria) TaxID=1871050 RepID=UPI002733DE30|nr:diguanylate cyclase [Bosea sp. (in: a-proteobacteria)]MDP3255317.1 diguanylate cyclase [Bosea sp. (in: a-proteobacteria)]MDP3317813.1 diguanylate cyclase [Bosea sp. (in: a-proteobacteria)]